MLTEPGIRPPLPPGPFLVVGLARSGEAIATVLAARGETVLGTDSGRSAAIDAAQRRLSAAGVEVVHDASPDALLSRVSTVVKSPGVPRHSPVTAAATARGLPVLGELELAWRLLDNDFIAVTGTNGKTTTTEWIGHIHRVAGHPVEVAGNVGTALSTLVGHIEPDATIVCEASSFQLEDTDRFAPDAALLLNLEPDHLDRHGSFDAYAEAKARIFARQRPDQLAFLPEGLDRPFLGAARVIRFGDPAALPTRELSLPGAHNAQNAMAASAVCLARGIDPAAVAEGLRTFHGVRHRLELVAERAGVRWVNDSKATNVASTAVALRSFPDRVRLIAGGRGKDQDFSPLAPLVGERCAAVYLIGEAADDIADAIAPSGVRVVRAGDLRSAVALAGPEAGTGDVVLLSPACASYDQFDDFEQRGDAFRALVVEGGR